VILSPEMIPFHEWFAEKAAVKPLGKKIVRLT
jgi:hypothetical protein